MRALSVCGLCVLGALISGACGGESSLEKDPLGSGAGDSGNGDAGRGSDGPGGNEGGAAGDPGSGSGGRDPGPGEGGDDGGPVTGGKGSGATSGGIGGGVIGGGPSVPTGGKGNPPPPPNGGVIGMGGSIGSGGDDGGGNECVPSTSSASDYCSISLQCDSEYFYTNCSNQGTGRWYCDCSTLNGYQAYEVTGITGFAACQTVQDICRTGGDPDITGPEECSAISESRASSYCQLQQQCVRKVEITEEVDATLTRQRYVSCNDNGGGRMYCSCDDGRSYEITGQDGNEACDTMLDVCGDPDIDFDGPLTCVPDLQSSGSNYCESVQRCSRALEVDGGTVHVTTESRSASCQSKLDGGSSCYCYNGRTQLRFETDLPTTDVNTCSTFAEDCASVDELGLHGPIACAPSYQSASATYCDAGVECTQAGTMGGQEVRAYGTISAFCQPSNGAWACTCNSGIDSASVEVDASTGWDACSELVEVCPDLVDVKIGEDFGFPMPIPF